MRCRVAVSMQLPPLSLVAAVALVTLRPRSPARHRGGSQRSPRQRLAPVESPADFKYYVAVQRIAPAGGQPLTFRGVRAMGPEINTRGMHVFPERAVALHARTQEILAATDLRGARPVRRCAGADPG